MRWKYSIFSEYIIYGTIFSLISKIIKVERIVHYSVHQAFMDKKYSIVNNFCLGMVWHVESGLYGRDSVL